jgi:hypothetical protein
MNRFVLKNTFYKNIYHFSINIFIKTRSQSYTLETVLLSKMTLFVRREYKLWWLLLYPMFHDIMDIDSQFQIL